MGHRYGERRIVIDELERQSRADISKMREQGRKEPHDPSFLTAQEVVDETSYQFGIALAKLNNMIVDKEVDAEVAFAAVGIQIGGIIANAIFAARSVDPPLDDGEGGALTIGALVGGINRGQQIANEQYDAAEAGTGAYAASTEFKYEDG